MTVQSEQSPIFILSAERSGSTLLRYMLDSHPDVGSPGEILLGELCFWLTHALRRLRPDGDLTHSETEVLAEARQLVDGIMGPYLARTRKRIWCEKTPRNLKYLPWLSKVFPDARFICLHRSCFDTVYSCIEASRYGFMSELQEYVLRSPGNLVQAMVESWVEKNTTIAMFQADRPKASHRLLYEDLVSNPEAELMRVCGFLNLRWDPEMVTKALQIEHYQGGGDPKIRREKEVHQRSIGRGKEIPSLYVDSLPAPLIGRMNQLSRLLGYEQP